MVFFFVFIHTSVANESTDKCESSIELALEHLEAGYRPPHFQISDGGQ